MAEDRESKYTVSKEDPKKVETKSEEKRAAEEKEAAEKEVTVDKVVEEEKIEEETQQLADLGVVLDNGAVDSFGDPVSPIDQVISLDADDAAVIAADGSIIGSKKIPEFVPGWLEQIQANQSKAGPPVTLSFNEQVKGWVSFKSYHKENGVTVNNQYYTFDNGSMWQHHINPIRNMFYGAAPTTEEHSYVTIIFNDAPSSVKNFQNGYKELLNKNFFGIKDKDLSKLNVIDKINIFFKTGLDVGFDVKEKLLASKVAKCKTPEDVLKLAIEISGYHKKKSKEQKEKIKL